MTNPTKPRKVVLHPAQVLSQFEIMTPEEWGTSPAQVEVGCKLKQIAREMGIPLLLIGWPDGVRIAVTTLLPPCTVAWELGILKGYLSNVTGRLGLCWSSQL